jgi:hypothetical protein
MAFILLLLLTITSLVRVETSLGEMSKFRLKAEQNAHLALRVAIGELQKSAGPDKRVTATADLLPSTDLSRKHTVGVWSSAAASILGLSEGQLLTWLASDAKIKVGDWFKTIQKAPHLK